jgi:hypothetical protein
MKKRNATENEHAQADEQGFLHTSPVGDKTGKRFSE